MGQGFPLVTHRGGSINEEYISEIEEARFGFCSFPSVSSFLTLESMTSCLKNECCIEGIIHLSWGLTEDDFGLVNPYIRKVQEQLPDKCAETF